MKEERKLHIGDAQLMVIALIRAAMEERGYSGRRLSEESGIGNTRCAEILRGNRVLTIDEFDSMCRALGLIPWMVMREAEKSLAKEEIDDAPIPFPSGGVFEVYDGSQPPERSAAQAGNVGAEQGTPDDLGEDSQIPLEDWDE